MRHMSIRSCIDVGVIITIIPVQLHCHFSCMHNNCYKLKIVKKLNQEKNSGNLHMALVFLMQWLQWYASQFFRCDPATVVCHVFLQLYYMGIKKTK